MVTWDAGGMTYRPPQEQKLTYEQRVREHTLGVRRDESLGAVLCSRQTKSGEPCRGIAGESGICAAHVRSDQAAARRGDS